MMDMPAAVTETVNSIDWSNASAAVEDYAPAIDVVKKTWDKESLRDILSGRIAVPDDVINNAIADHIDGASKVTKLVIASQSDGRLKINADTKSMGRVELLGTIDEFVHDGDQSYVTYTLKKRSLLDHGTLSWIFSRISLSMAQKIVGKIDLGDELPSKTQGNTITIDYSELLNQSDLGQTAFMGYNLLDALRIEKAEPHDGYVEFTTGLNVPDSVKTMLINILL
ncbi:MAG: hypothetical protein WCS30_01640 [Selenomonadaceae bacterium]